jgi:hypothetical protein
LIAAIALGYEAAYSSPFLLLDKPVVVFILDRFDRAPYCILRIKTYVYDHRSEPRMQSDITMCVKSDCCAGDCSRESQYLIKVVSLDKTRPSVAFVK